MRYLRGGKPSFPIADYTRRLEKVLVELPEDAVRSILWDMVNIHWPLLYELIARFVPMPMTSRVALLETVILEEKGKEDIISEAGEQSVERITTAFLDRGRVLMNIGSYEEAVQIASAVIMVIGPELENVYDEGITFQTILSDAFGLLKEVSVQQVSPETSELFTQMAIRFAQGRSLDRHCDKQWSGVISAFKSGTSTGE